MHVSLLSTYKESSSTLHSKPKSIIRYNTSNNNSKNKTDKNDNSLQNNRRRHYYTNYELTMIGVVRGRVELEVGLVGASVCVGPSANGMKTGRKRI